MKNNVRRSVLCQCGGDVYEKTYGYIEDKLVPVWRCDNCNQETARDKRARKTNRRLAIDTYLALREEWKILDDKLSGGGWLVHSSSMNYHMKKLVDLEKPTNFQLHYHKRMAREDLERAKAYVEKKNQ